MAWLAATRGVGVVGSQLVCERVWMGLVVEARVVERELVTAGLV